MKNLLLTLFTSYSFSFLLSNYITEISVWNIFAVTTVVFSIIFFTGNDSKLSKTILNFAAAIQLSPVMMFFVFEKVFIDTPNWLETKEIMIIALFMLFHRLDKIQRRKTRFLLHDNLVAVSMALMLADLGNEYVYNNEQFYMYGLPVLLTLCSMIFMDNKQSVFGLMIVNVVLCLGIANLLPTELTIFNNTSKWTVEELILLDAWFAMLISSLLFIGDFFGPQPVIEKREVNRATQSTQNQQRNRQQNYMESNAVYGSQRDYFKNNKKKYNKPNHFHNNHNNHHSSFVSHSPERDDRDDRLNYAGMNDWERELAYDNEFYGYSEAERERAIEKLEFGLPSYERTNFDDRDNENHTVQPFGSYDTDDEYPDNQFDSYNQWDENDERDRY